ncbi:MAG: hypothetical protein MZV64_10305 [Ignavibacteriales bacterium]|nr:hypothetical protein [Ignavibacteriales bacterium]
MRGHLRIEGDGQRAGGVLRFADQVGAPLPGARRHQAVRQAERTDHTLDDPSGLTEGEGRGHALLGHGRHALDEDRRTFRQGLGQLAQQVGEQGGRDGRGTPVGDDRHIPHGLRGRAGQERNRTSQARVDSKMHTHAAPAGFGGYSLAAPTGLAALVVTSGLISRHSSTLRLRYCEWPKQSICARPVMRAVGISLSRIRASVRPQNWHFMTVSLGVEPVLQQDPWREPGQRFARRVKRHRDSAVRPGRARPGPGLAHVHARRASERRPRCTRSPAATARGFARAAPQRSDGSTAPAGAGCRFGTRCWSSWLRSSVAHRFGGVVALPALLSVPVRNQKPVD